ncbi:hypothetical protein KQ304_11005 [Synechococcus sp. CS-1329]|uniref:Na+/H+ antiporter subunit E n=1 Tax=Synechococcus sp. CS-1329 TaxID=2847975 RepID=UPI0021E269B8|nr:Na+/H+ antiporter subunit E [Synechococcus sp. CS-1329]MCT0219515.1 hypothetical protein [Synechococcus sp. CS-1329]
MNRRLSARRVASWGLTTGFRLGIWLLLTSNVGRFNMVVGLILAMVLPRARSRLASPGLLLHSLWAVLLSIPQAYAEAVTMTIRPHRLERLTSLKGSGSQSALVVFLEVFRITLTPLTIALGQRADGSYLVHELVEEPPT